jgi:hypothetical protein
MGLQLPLFAPTAPSPNPPRTAWIIHVACDLLRTISGQFIEPIDDLAIAATPLDETIQPITAVASALLTTHAQHIELADEIAEDDCAVAGHGNYDRIESLACI